MKQISKLLLVLFSMAILVSCQCGISDEELATLTPAEQLDREAKRYNKSGKAICGEHKLHSIKSNSEIVYFTWENVRTKQVISSSLTRDKVRAVYDSDKPSIKFCWNNHSSNDMSSIMRKAVVYMELHCNEEHFPLDVNKTSSWTLTGGNDYNSTPNEVDVPKSASAVNSTWRKISVGNRYKILMFDLAMSNDESTEISKQAWGDIDIEIRRELVKKIY